jgi:hypothetical protein
METGNEACTLKATWLANTYYLAATAFQTINATPRASATTITSAAAGSNPLKVTMHFTVDDTTSNTALTGNLIRDRDAICGHEFRRRIQSLGMDEVITAARSPWQNAFAEQLIGSIRGEGLDHVFVSRAGRHCCVA